MLYIDARGTGFSYGIMDNPEDDIARQAEFSTKNFNCFLDGADFIRVVLRFLDEHPAIKGNPVYLVSESFGGIRSTHYPLSGHVIELSQPAELLDDIIEWLEENP